MEHERALREFLLASTHKFDFNLTDKQIQRFLIYLTQLLEWNRTINLTSITDPFEIIVKHFVDSITALCAFDFPIHSLVVDVGSGAGFPGIPLKLVRSDLRLALIESSNKKCSFLHFIVGALKLEQVSIHQETAQRFALVNPNPIADVVVLRALKLDDVIQPAAAILKPTGRLLLYRTECMDEQPVKLFQVESNHDFTLPLDHGKRVVTVLKRVALN